MVYQTPLTEETMLNIIGRGRFVLNPNSQGSVEGKALQNLSCNLLQI